MPVDLRHLPTPGNSQPQLRSPALASPKYATEFSLQTRSISGRNEIGEVVQIAAGKPREWRQAGQVHEAFLRSGEALHRNLRIRQLRCQPSKGRLLARPPRAGLPCGSTLHGGVAPVWLRKFPDRRRRSSKDHDLATIRPESQHRRLQGRTKTTSLHACVPKGFRQSIQSGKKCRLLLRLILHRTHRQRQIHLAHIWHHDHAWLRRAVGCVGRSTSGSEVRELVAMQRGVKRDQPHPGLSQAKRALGTHRLANGRGGCVKQAAFNSRFRGIDQEEDGWWCGIRSRARA
mmetsp:Transcript_95698/g.310074  ORF Transcript_95698/g.310074 Transcript_95698/m.310074 type:complete len:288 (-) Transcript_95698:683-1546(-)